MPPKKKKLLPPRCKRMGRQSRLASARHWLVKYEGKNVVRGYRKHYGVDLLCAVKELQMLGVKLDHEYVDRLKHSEKLRIEQKQTVRERKRKELLEEIYKDSDDTFAYIAGYTSWGFPYGVTWEEAGMEPPDFDDI
jgi:hypothetical protein